MANGRGGAIIAWTHTPDGIYCFNQLCRVTSAGNLDTTGWSDWGPSHYNPWDPPKLVPDDSSGVYVLYRHHWDSYRWTGRVGLTHRLMDGTSDPRWPRSGLQLIDAWNLWGFWGASESGGGLSVTIQSGYDSGIYPPFGYFIETALSRVRRDGAVTLRSSLSPVYEYDGPPAVLGDGFGGTYAAYQGSMTFPCNFLVHVLANGTKRSRRLTTGTIASSDFSLALDGHGGAYGTQGWIDPQKDLFVIQGIVLMFSFVYVLVNLGIDLIYTVIDPRIQY